MNSIENDATIYIAGVVGNKATALMKSIQDNATGKIIKVERARACAACGISNCTRFCSLCREEAYCGKKCQRERWREHKRHAIKKIRGEEIRFPFRSLKSHVNKLCLGVLSPFSMITLVTIYVIEHFSKVTPV